MTSHLINTTANISWEWYVLLNDAKMNVLLMKGYAYIAEKISLAIEMWRHVYK